MSKIIEALDNEQMDKDIPDFAPGDSVVVQVKVREGTRERLQAFEGVVIAKRNRGLNSSFTVRKISHGEGVERVFQTYSPVVDSDCRQAPRRRPPRQAVLPARAHRQSGENQRKNLVSLRNCRLGHIRGRGGIRYNAPNPARRRRNPAIPPEPIHRHGVRRPMRKLLLALVAALPLAGCSTLMSSAMNNLADNVTAAMLDQVDPETAKAALPTFIVLLDSALQGNPNDPDTLAAGAQMYATYGAVFATEPVRASRLTTRARDYALRAMCESYTPSCGWRDAGYDEFVASLDGVGKKAIGIPVRVRPRLARLSACAQR